VWTIIRISVRLKKRFVKEPAKKNSLLGRQAFIDLERIDLYDYRLATFGNQAVLPLGKPLAVSVGGKI